MTDKLPPNLLKLFAPRPPLPYAPPLDNDPGNKRSPRFTGLAEFLPSLNENSSQFQPTETLMQKKARIAQEKKIEQEQRLKNQLETWKPNEDTTLTGEAFNTLFVGRLSYDVTEKDLRHEFDLFGDIKSIHIIQDKNTNTSRGYAFIEYEREKDMKAAYREADGVRLKGRRVVVDVERGRTQKGWKPRRLGGGLGNTRKGGKDENQRHSGREVSSSRQEHSGSNGYHDNGHNRESRPRYAGGGRDYHRGGRSRSPRGQRERHHGRDYGRERGYYKDYDRHRRY
ncbi:RNA-binding domain-containing protein [Conidiobolus coronatus NRRL 28638]|uniref:U1 small nuclear ribonucleoprotein 70 kDa n=1 Tax=Conidiobolus coronatus (strain ATCC 28846 / CBS 209.66 / NRRL 28638) TaxID=796925 RepID=A0A137NXX0_CONC2|nr:RNA-binding domain-containing protein [Conidiobolus coronatus NRRL 28638]|eukprot:KXN67528.1 RNA-binding domain-containing protein [Conidiobolus coronatus NRRL 28638]